MIFRILRFNILIALLTALWWAAIWFVLPVSWLQISPSALLALHIAPPLGGMLAWRLCKRLWAWRTTRAKQAANKAETEQKQAAGEKTSTQRRQALERRRATLECRSEWVVVLKKPKWSNDGDGDDALLSVPSVENLQSDDAPAPDAAKRETATREALKDIFSTAFNHCPALAWLPIFVLPGQNIEAKQLEALEQPWQEAVNILVTKKVPLPPSPSCKFLPGSGEIIDRVIALFEHDPSLPALILLGMDSPSSGASGYALAAVLLSRPGLSIETGMDAAASENASPYTPYWERERIRLPGQPRWGNIPASLQPSFLQDLPPTAALHRSWPLDINPSTAERTAVLKQRFENALSEALINAALREPPSEKDEDKKAEKGGKDGKGEAAQADTKETEPLELGWFVHDSTNSKNFGTFGAALADFDCEIDPVSEASNLIKEHGNVGAARGVLILAEALIRARQLQKTVLIAGFGDDGSGGIGIGLIRPSGQS